MKSIIKKKNKDITKNDKAHYLHYEYFEYYQEDRWHNKRKSYMFQNRMHYYYRCNSIIYAFNGAFIEP
jgi:hypothetical protein